MRLMRSWVRGSVSEMGSDLDGVRRVIRMFGVVCALCAALTVAACGSSDEDSSTSAGGATTAQGPSGTLRIGLEAAPLSLDPAKDGGGFPVMLESLTHVPLIYVNADGSFGPGLATKWRYVGSGNREFELTLRHDARFSDGTPVTADAVKGWLTYFAKARGPYANLISIESIAAVDRWTVRVKLTSSNPDLPQVFSQVRNWSFVSSPKAVASPKVLGTKTFGAGPYMLDSAETVTNEKYTFVPNPYFYDRSRIRFQKVTVQIIADPSSMLSAIKTGQLDVASGRPETADAAAAAGLEIEHLPAVWTSLWFMDRDGRVAKPLGDVRVRQALNYAVDRKAITTAILGRWGTPTSQIMQVGAYDPADADHYPYDPEKAKELLAEAGYARGFSLDVVANVAEKDDKYIQAAAKYLEAVGVTLKLTRAPTGPDYVEKVFSGKFPATSLNNGVSVTIHSSYSNLFNKRASWNIFRHSDPELDRLAEEGARASDPAPYWQQMTDRITDQAWAVPLYATDILFFASKNIGGFDWGIPQFMPDASVWYEK